MFSIGNLIKKFRVSKGWTQTELAKKMQVSQSLIALWENDTRHPHRRTLEKLANIFEVPMDYFDPEPPEEAVNRVLNEISEWYNNLPENTSYFLDIVKDSDGDELDFIYQVLDYLKEMSRENREDVIRYCERIILEQRIKNVDELEGIFIGCNKKVKSEKR